MAVDFDGSTQYLNRANEVHPPGNLTLSCWANSDTQDGNERTLVAVSHTSTASRVARLQTASAAAPPNLYAQVINNAVGINHRANVATQLPLSTWYHAGGTFSSTSSVIAYLNGVAGSAVQTVSGAIATTNSLQIGALNFGGTILQFFNGRIAEVALWNVVLTAAEMLILSKGYSPLFVRRANLKAYWPLFGRFNPEPMTGGLGVAGVAQDLTLINSPLQSAHPRIIYPGSISAPVVATAVVEEEAVIVQRLMMMGMGQ